MAKTVPRSVTEKVLSQYIKKVIEAVDTKIGEARKLFEAKIEYSRKDAGEQFRGVQKALNTRADRIDSAIKELKENIKLKQLFCI